MKHKGYTYVELAMALAIAGLLIAGLMGVVGTATKTGEEVGSRNDITRDARFAMQRMVNSVNRTRKLLIPMVDKVGTQFVENVREQFIPAASPPAGSSFATAVLAVALATDVDLDDDGIADADNDGDLLIDEDLPADSNNDGKPGISGIDDDGAGFIDYSGSDIADDDESANLAVDEDPINGIDDDGEGLIDEDPGADNNGDGCSGICGVDDDGDGSLDESVAEDDDEDGQSDEDWYDPVVFYIGPSGSLIERTPVPWDTNGDAVMTGQDYVESVIAENVSRFRVERIPASAGSPQLVDLILELTDPDSGESISLQTQVRVGGAL
jgi:type II secretory pathway pseudopilin PulG